MLLLLQEPHLTTLFDLLEMLACFKPPSPNTEKVQESPEVGVSHGRTVQGMHETYGCYIWLTYKEMYSFNI